MNTPERLKRRAKLLVAALLMSAAGALVYTAAHAQTLAAPTRISPYDWACLDANGAVLSNHQRFDTAFVACYNNPAGAEIVGGRYRLVRATPPPTACPAQPADETRAGTCPDGTTGSWTQMRTYTSAPAPTCWSAGSWVPVDPPAGACTVPPPVLSQPTLSAVRTDSTTAGRHTINLSWTVSENATTYSVERCTVALPAPAPCTNFAGLLGAGQLTVLTFANTNLPAGFSYSYRLRGRDGLRDLSSPWSNVVTIAIPTEVVPPPPPPPPPPATGQVTITVVPNPTYTSGQPALLGGHWLYWTSVESPLPKAIRLPPTESSYVFKGAPGFYTFYVFAFDRDGNMGLQSDFVTKAIQ